MIRITKMSGKYYGIELTNDYEKEWEEIIGFANQGILVIIVEELEELKDLDICDEVVMIDRG